MSSSRLSCRWSNLIWSRSTVSPNWPTLVGEPLEVVSSVECVLPQFRAKTVFFQKVIRVAAELNEVVILRLDGLQVPHRQVLFARFQELFQDSTGLRKHDFGSLAHAQGSLDFDDGLDSERLPIQFIPLFGSIRGALGVLIRLEIRLEKHFQIGVRVVHGQVPSRVARSEVFFDLRQVEVSRVVEKRPIGVEGLGVFIERCRHVREVLQKDPQSRLRAQRGGQCELRIQRFGEEVFGDAGLESRVDDPQCGAFLRRNWC